MGLFYRLLCDLTDKKEIVLDFAVSVVLNAECAVVKKGFERNYRCGKIVLTGCGNGRFVSSHSIISNKNISKIYFHGV